jgi:hypothetical protein
MILLMGQRLHRTESISDLAVPISEMLRIST